MSIKFCVVIPTYNNAQTLSATIKKIAQQTNDIIIVNDGSTDQTSEILGNYQQFTIITHLVNQGKGMALRNAFNKAISLGYDYAITIDSDGQHDPEDIAKVQSACEDNNGALVMGSRNMGQDGIPKKSSFGNNFSNFWFWAETGIKLSDTQTGFRAYPLRSIEGVKWFTRRFEFEIEVIVRLAWKNVKFVEQPIQVSYHEDRVSHFRPLKDFGRISILNTVLFTLALLFYLPKLMIQNFSVKNLFRQVKNEFVINSGSPHKLAGSVGLGLFFGVFPIWGFQMMAAYAISSILKFNRIIVLFSSNISLPPMIPFIIYSSFTIGGLFFAEPLQFFEKSELTLSSIYLHIWQYTIGAIILSLVMAVMGYVVTWLLAVLFFRKRILRES